MTRISAGIGAKELCDQHLIKERIEILRIPNAIKSGKAKVNQELPKTYRLGKGHVKFFYDKVKYLQNRYNELTKECKDRGFATTDYSDAFEGIPSHLMNDYEASSIDRRITKERVVERMRTMDKIRYRGKTVTLHQIKQKL